jgi:hypothetical protein
MMLAGKLSLQPVQAVMESMAAAASAHRVSSMPESSSFPTSSFSASSPTVFQDWDAGFSL